MVKRVNAAQLQSKMRAAPQKVKREADRVDRENKRRVDAYNREVKRVNENNRRVNEHNRKVNAQNQRAVTQLNSRLRSTRNRSVSYTPAEQELADRVQHGMVDRDDREWDVFLSYARIDGSVVATELKEELEVLGVRVWFDEVAIAPGRSQSLQMDKGLRTARSGVVLLTPAYLTGRFWTERELGVLLGKATLIPVLNGVSFKDVAEYSGFLPDLAGFETTRDAVQVIAEKIAAAVLPAESSPVG